MVLGVQFEPLEKLRHVHLGLLWQEFRERYPLVQEHPPLSASFERFGDERKRPSRIEVELAVEPIIPRLWFISGNGRRLVQVQGDRFLFNWRKLTGREEYPRYEQLRATFADELAIFTAFLEREKLGTPRPNQCEITYVNELRQGQGWTSMGDLDQILSVWQAGHRDGSAPELEAATVEQRYVLPGADGRPQGRVHVSLEPYFSLSLDQEVYLLRVTAQGRPEGPDLDAALRFIDTAHHWAVLCFAAATTPHLHQVWGRRR